MKFRLKEAYSDSMPKVIRDYLSKHNSIRNNLLDDPKWGIDIANAKFNHYAPYGERDPIFKRDDQKLIFFTFPDTYPDWVYIKGINDLDNSFTGEIWKYTGPRIMLKQGVDIWYVDLNEVGPNSKIPQLRQDRNKYQLSNDPFRRYDINHVNAKNYAYRWGSDDLRDPSGIKVGKGGVLAGNIDKSGYLINPKKYIDKLTNSPNYRPDKKLIDVINNVHDEIVSLNARLVNGYGTVPETDLFNGKSNIYNFRNALSQISEAITQFNAGMSQLKDFTQYLDNNQVRSTSSIDRYTRDINYRIGQAREYCKNAISNMADLLPTVVDWDTEDYVDDGL